MTEGRTGLAEYLTAVLSGITPLRPLDLALHDAHGGVLAEGVTSSAALPPFDAAGVDGYAVRADDVAGATPESPIRLSVVGDVTASSWRPSRVSPGACFSVAAGAPLPAGADAVVPVSWTDGGMVAIEVAHVPTRGAFVRRAGQDLAAGAVIAPAGAYVGAALVGLLAACGVDHVVVRPRPRVVVVATGDELVDTGRAGAPGQVVDANSHALTAAAVEAGAQAYRVGITADDPDALRALLDDQLIRADLVVTTGGTGTGPGDMVRRTLGREGVVFTDLSVHPTDVLGFGQVGVDRTPVVCLPGDPASALIGFEVLARPVIQRLAGAEPVYRPSVRANLQTAVHSPRGLREFRPARVAERRGGGYTAEALPVGLTGLADANGLMVLGERVSAAPAGETVDVLLFDRRR
ncbi:MAG TPA: gephyrin-like molybdotransferase Glp [Mycobacteriales bacterium]|nr:molybdenum cofactor synthesis protein [Cryptosporangiaceae bacterium]MDQ1679054.1 molybdopterin molybdotransferase [Actinomycetota bacterium]HEV7755731.1 gephyrin-like molybdotransferase Glp [Mycobacteriales bacterium]